MKTFFIIWPLWVLGILFMADACAVFVPSFSLYVGAGLIGMAASWPQFQAAMRVGPLSLVKKGTPKES